MKKLLIFLSTILLSSCIFLTENHLNQTINTDSFLNRFPQNQKTIIILKFSGKKGDRIYLCKQENFFSSNKNDCQTIYAEEQYHILMLAPNLYYLFAAPENLPIFSRKKAKKEEQYLTILEAKAGEMIYAGNIVYQRSINKFTVSDSFDLVENILSGKNSQNKEELFTNQIWEINYLIKEYSTLKNRFKKKLLKNFELRNPNSKTKLKNSLPTIS